ncbi:MAG: tetratricopeptide repeat protein [Spartobacteria bacterium]
MEQLSSRKSGLTMSRSVFFFLCLIGVLGLAALSSKSTGQAPSRPKVVTTVASIHAGVAPLQDSPQVNSHDAAAFGIRGDAALEAGDYDRALEQYQRMVELRPDLSSMSRRANALWLDGNQSHAMRVLEKAIRGAGTDSSKTASCQAQLALLLFADGAILPAQQVLAPALVAVPQNVSVLLAAGRVAAGRNDFLSARRYYQSLLKISPNHEALVALGDLSALRGGQEIAEEYYKQVEHLRSAQSDSNRHEQMQMAKFYADHDRKLAEAGRLVEPHKLTQNVLDADVLAWVYFKNGDLPHAREAMRRALRRHTPDAEMHYHAGMIAAASGERGAARRELGEAFSLNPRFSLLQAPIAHRMMDKLVDRSDAKPSPAKIAAGLEN